MKTKHGEHQHSGHRTGKENILYAFMPRLQKGHFSKAFSARGSKMEYLQPDPVRHGEHEGVNRGALSKANIST